MLKSLEFHEVSATHVLFTSIERLAAVPGTNYLN